jgi:hypothetical protein
VLIGSSSARPTNKTLAQGGQGSGPAKLELVIPGREPRAKIPRPLVWIVVAGNAAWALVSIALLFSSAMQAIAIGVFAELQ